MVDLNLRCNFTSGSNHSYHLQLDKLLIFHGTDNKTERRISSVKKKRTYINRQKYLPHCQGMVWIYARHTTIHLASNEYIIFKHIKFSMRSFFSNGAAPFVLFSFTLCANLASFQPTQNFVFYMSTVFKFVYHDDLAKTFTYSIHSFISIFRTRYSITIKYGVDLWNDEMTAINLILLLKITKK